MKKINSVVCVGVLVALAACGKSTDGGGSTTPPTDSGSSSGATRTPSTETPVAVGGAGTVKPGDSNSTAAAGTQTPTTTTPSTFSGAAGSCTITTPAMCINFRYTTSESSDPGADAKSQAALQCGSIGAAKYSDTASCDTANTSGYCVRTTQEKNAAGAYQLIADKVLPAGLSASDAAQQCDASNGYQFSATP